VSKGAVPITDDIGVERQKHDGICALLMLSVIIFVVVVLFFILMT